ncbi:transglutaminase family protein [Cellulosimicrobium marinum]|uniref:transglutaminase family protein n=1 Tax=Cellulosimicrobium marinum TaxID=1638992 RepID=UPI001E499A87|nr:DUF3488 and transglutaminase-like domain-containing protein [Cellulosimicrobium marinum]MCB7137773.1 DUF3488 and transglutaminase-like domain-containing protein [Cellulosimicrobium marinum]
MSSPRTTGAPGRRTLATTACVTVAVLASMHALGAVIGPGDWTRTGVRTVLVLAVVTGVTRWLLERSATSRGETLAPPAALLPSAAGLLVGAWGLLGLYGGPTDRFSVLIGLSNADRLASRLVTARELTLAEVAPIGPSLPIELLAVGGTVVVFLVADLLAGGLRIAAATGLPLLALWVPGLVIVGDVPAVPFVLTVAALVLLLAVDNPHRTARRAAAPSSSHRTAGGLRAAAAAATALAVAVVGLGVSGASANLPEVASSSWSRLFASTGETVRLSDDLDMRRDLAERSDQVVLRYRTDAAELGPLRVFTLTGFDGTNWRRGADRSGDPVEDPGALLWPEETDPGEPADVDVTIESLRDAKLPVPTEPRSLDSDGAWRYDPVRDEVVGDRPTSAGTRYGVTVYPRPLDAETLREARGADPDDPNYLDVPASVHEQEIRELAAQVAGDAATRYDQALALQTFFRDTTTFTYSTQVPAGETGDAVWDFLQHRTGYCVQFATSMTMMARSLGIPARLGVGFLPGTEVGDDSFEVTGQDSHAWPELYFPGQGWVRFEPTPAQQTGAAPRWAIPVGDAGAPGFPLPEDAQTPGEAVTPSAEPTPTTATTGPSAVTTTSQDDGVPWILVLAALVVLGLAVTAWVLARRRSSRGGTQDAEGAWTELGGRLSALDVGWPASATPRQVPTAVNAAVVERSGDPLGDEALSALVTLCEEVERVRYARTTAPSLAPDRLGELVEAVVVGARLALSDRPARDGAPSALRAG